MHLVLLGVLKRILASLTKGPGKCKLSQQLLSQISERLLSHNGLMPSEFNRQPRSLSELSYWKSTELRQFLLYHGPVVLKGIVSKEVYKHFIALHVATVLLLKPDVDTDEVLYAKQLLIWFVQNSEVVYGETFNVYNVNSLIHLADDVLYFKASLDEISAFKFEHFMQTVKKSVKSSKNPVSQVVKRMLESDCNFNFKSDKPTCFKMKEQGKDSCFLTKSGDICFIDKINEGSIECRIIHNGNLDMLYDAPISSKQFGITYIRHFEKTVFKRKTLTMLDMAHKIVRLPHKNGFAFFPLLQNFTENRF